MRVAMWNGMGPTRAGIGRTAQGLDELRTSCRDALDCLEALRHVGGERRLLRYEDLGVAGLLLRVVDVGEVSDSVRRTLGPLIDPQTYGGDLLETLWQFLSADGNRHAAAQQLHGLRARGAAGAPGTWPAVTVGIPDITVQQRALSYCAEAAGLPRWARTRHASPNWSRGCGGSSCAESGRSSTSATRRPSPGRKGCPAPRRTHRHPKGWDAL